MVRRFVPYLTVAAVFAAAPAFAGENLLIADASSSKSRAEARHDTSGDVVEQSNNARSKSRRATRSGASADTVVATQNRGKRSRRNPGKEALSEPMIASKEAAPALITLASNTDVLAERIETADFTGDAGALALYKLVGKVTAEMPLGQAEADAFAMAMTDTNLSWLISDTEARLTEAAGGDDLDAIAEALGIPRPVATPGMQPNLGASLAVETEVSPG